MSRPDEHAFLAQVLREDVCAIDMCKQLFQVSQVIDDLVDCDRPVSEAEIIKSFWVALIEIPANPFYRKHELYLRPIMATALQDWTDSVALERSGDAHGKHLAFVLRDQLTALVVQCAYLVGGHDWMQSVSIKIRRHFHEDSLVDYINDLTITNAVKHEE